MSRSWRQRNFLIYCSLSNLPSSQINPYSKPQTVLLGLTGLDAKGNGIVAIVRNYLGSGGPKMSTGVSGLKSCIEARLPPGNVINLARGEAEDEDEHFSKMRGLVLKKLETLVNESVERDPEIKSRKKMVQEIYAESMAHLAGLREVIPADEDDPAVQKVKELMVNGKFDKHGPILLKGFKSSGKSGIIARLV